MNTWNHKNSIQKKNVKKDITNILVNIFDKKYQYTKDNFPFDVYFFSMFYFSFYTSTRPLLFDMFYVRIMSLDHKTSLCTRITRCEHQNQNFEWLMSESEYEFRARNFLISRPDAPVNSIVHTSCRSFNIFEMK